MVLKRLLVLLLLASTLACTNSGGGGGDGHIDGTSDTGGGSGLENRAYEAYIVKVDQLPAYKALIEPKINKLLALAPNGALAEKVMKGWLLYKTWYVAPVTLDTISTDVIGVSFSTDKSEQLALQTKKSIWIDSRRFGRMAMQDQAALVIHEMVMSLYYLKFKSWENICTEKIYPDINCEPKDADLMNELFPGSDPKPFNSDDYENIRAVTGVLLQDFKFSSTKELDQFLIANKFDPRFTFGMGLDGEGIRQTVIINNSEKLSLESMQQILETAKLLNQLPDQCRGVRLKDPIDCNFTFENSSRRLRDGTEYPVLAITTQSLNRGVDLKFTGTRRLLGEVTGSSLEFVQQKKKLYYWTFNPDPFPTPLKVGTLFRSLNVITIQDLQVPSPPHTLLGVQSIPGVVVGKNAQFPDECTYAKPTAKSLLDDVVIVHSKYLTDLDKALLRARAASMPPMTTCRPF